MLRGGEAFLKRLAASGLWWKGAGRGGGKVGWGLFAVRLGWLCRFLPQVILAVC